jgi:photosystem II stability/assembly factor-like uncharacterized protein
VAIALPVVKKPPVSVGQAVPIDITDTSPATPDGLMLIGYMDLTFIDASHGWLVKPCPGPHRLFRTSDGGKSWQPLPGAPLMCTIGSPIHPSPGTIKGALGSVQHFHVRFATARDGWLFDPTQPYARMPWAEFLVTRDGGETWNPAALPRDGHVVALEARGASVLAIVRDLCRATPDGRPPTCDYHLFTSPDVGRTWVASPLALPKGSFGNVQLVRAGSSAGWILYQPGGPGSQLLFATRDGGITWQAQANPCPSELDKLFSVQRISAPDSEHVWFLCGGGAQFPTQQKPTQQKMTLISSTGGRTWTPAMGTLPDTGIIVESYYQQDSPGTGFTASSKGSAWVVLRNASGEQDRALGEQLLGTIDGGRSWKTVFKTAIANSGQLSIVFADSNHGWLATPSAVWATSDGGAHWTRVPIP